MNNNTYINTETLIVMKFGVFHPDEKVYPVIPSLLEAIPRETLIRVMQLLENILFHNDFEK